MCWRKLKLLSNTTPRLRAVFDGDVSLPSKLTGKWLMTLFRCCSMSVIIRYVLSGLSFSLFVSIQSNMSVKQLLKVERNSSAFDCESDIIHVCQQHTGDD